MYQTLSTQGILTHRAYENRNKLQLHPETSKLRSIIPSSLPSIDQISAGTQKIIYDANLAKTKDLIFRDDLHKVTLRTNQDAVSPRLT